MLISFNYKEMFLLFTLRNTRHRKETKMNDKLRYLALKWALYICITAL